MTQTISTISRQEEQHRTLRTQVGGNGNGGQSIPTIAITGPEDDNEPHVAVQAAEALLIRQRIARLINVTDACNVITTPLTFLREQHGNATLAFFEDGGAM